MMKTRNEHAYMENSAIECENKLVKNNLDMLTLTETEIKRHSRETVGG